MGTVRFFSGGRDIGSKKSVANDIMRLELQKKGKMDASARFKLIMKMKLEEAKKKYKEGQPQKAMSKQAEKALKEIAQKKASKEAKKMRQMVIVQPQIYQNGRLTKNGKVYDLAGNMVATVNKKNGKMATMLGTSLGKYKPKSQFVNALLVDTINKHSPYFINLRKLQAMQAAGIDPMTGQPLNREVINVHGNSNSAMHGGNYVPPSEIAPVSFDNTYGESSGGPRQNIGATAWGARSDNVWGTYTDNVWGVSTDNVWGGNSSDVWGGIGGNPFGGKSVQIWGTGNGKNYIKALSNFINKLLGRVNKKTADAFKNARTTRNVRTGANVTTTRSSGPSTTRR